MSYLGDILGCLFGGIGIEKNWFRKKISEPVAGKFGTVKTKKVSEQVLEKFGTGKKFWNLYRKNFILEKVSEPVLEKNWYRN